MMSYRVRECLLIHLIWNRVECWMLVKRNNELLFLLKAGSVLRINQMSVSQKGLCSIELFFPYFRLLHLCSLWKIP
jgi:hypothetical protein